MQQQTLVTYFRILSLVGALMWCSGCGLIPIPYPRTLPGQVTSFEVYDSETHEQLSQVEAVCSYERFKNWLPAFPPSIRTAFYQHPEFSLQLFPQSNGEVAIEKKRVAAYLRPVGITPLGTTIIEDYIVTISVKAPGYLPCAVSYYPNAAPVGVHHWENGTRTELSDDGHLRISLDKQTSVPVAAIQVADVRTKAFIAHAKVWHAVKRLPVRGNEIPLYVSNGDLFSDDSESRLEQQADGIFHLPLVPMSSERTELEVMPDGETLYEVEVGMINVMAPEYEPFFLVYSPTAKPLGRKQWHTGNITEFTSEGILTIYLTEYAQE